MRPGSQTNRADFWEGRGSGLGCCGPTLLRWKDGIVMEEYGCNA
jgi:hypothetical protein